MDITAGVWVPERPVLLKPRLFLPGEGLEDFFGLLPKEATDLYKTLLSSPREKWSNILMMAGSLTFYASQKIADLLLGKTAYAGETNIYGGLWMGALDDTFNGATANEANYGSYGRLLLANNTTNFGPGSGSTTYTKNFPSDAAHNFVTSTGTPVTLTYLGFLNGNAGTSGDKGVAYTTITSTPVNPGDTPQLAQNAITGIFD
jgi:hypothetical protein